MKKTAAFFLIMSLMIPFLFSCHKEQEVEELKGPIFDLTSEEREIFSNYIDLDGASIGDPFVMRYDGKYYLYPSAQNNAPWYVYVSEDLVHWSEKIECVSMNEIPSGVHESGTYCDALSAYAPEVTYYNGKFIMVTSPGGTGHRFFISDSPTGPFKQLEGNYARKIDGHIFIDNDGKWYFYSANGAGIKLYEMPSPTTITNEIGTLSQINKGWTEGPMVVYHDGVYFMTYTGNHVRNAAYRIPYSVSTTSPTSFTEPDDNILLVSTKGEITATGHSSTVKAPNLDAYYIVYHSKLENGQRRMNIDRIVFDGQTMDVFGPTSENQCVPEMPDVYAFFDSREDGALFENVEGADLSNGRVHLNGGTKLITKKALSGDKYTLEITTANMSSGAMAGAVFAYSDDNNYATAVFDSAQELLVVTFVKNGAKTIYKKALVRSFGEAYDFSATQAIQIEKSGNTFTFYVNDRELCKYDSTLSGTKVGLICESGKASFGYFGASDEVGGSSNCEYYKPVGASSGRINANLCTEDITAFIGRDNDGSSFVSANTDNSFNYRVYAEEDGLYSFGVKYRATENTELDIYVNGVLARSLTLGTTDAKYMTEVSLGKLMLSKGRNVITVYVRSGNADIKSYEILRTESAEMTLDFNNGSIDEHLVHSDGVSWENASGKLQCRAIGKRTFGSTLWSDYAYRCKIIFAQNIDMGLLFRTKNAAESGLFASGRGFFTEPSINGSTKGADWMQGYYLHFTNNKVALEKCNFSNTELVSTRITTDGTTSVNVTVVCTGPNIKVYLDELLVIDYTDPDPFLTGAVGVRLSSGVGAFDNIKVIPYKEQ
ncbi:MAG: hypothetical protein E7626_01825 [Ruminococcaceae bacterium]|nr:hypothetical protein [Oscillospiraceae bacterium]